MKKAIIMMMSTMMVGALALTGISATLASDVPAKVNNDPVIAMPIEKAPTSIKVFSKVKSVVTSAKSTKVTVEGINGDIILNVSPETIIIDSTSKLPTGVKDIKKGAEIIAWHSPAMTMSLPPQSAAIAIAVNLPKASDETSAIANYHVAGDVVKNKNGSVSVTSADGDIIITIAKDASVTPFKTKNMVTLNDIEEGTMFFAFYNVVAESYPAQANTSTVVILPGNAKDDEAVTLPELSGSQPVVALDDAVTLPELNEDMPVADLDGAVTLPELNEDMPVADLDGAVTLPELNEDMSLAALPVIKITGSSIFVNDTKISAKTVSYKNMKMVPVKAITEAIGADFNYSSEDKSYTVSMAGTELFKFKSGSNVAYVLGKKATMPAKAVTSKSVVYICADALKALPFIQLDA